MSVSSKTWSAAVALIAAAAVAGCGEDDFENRARPAVSTELTGVIQDDKLTVSPGKVNHAGPVLITISNQTKAEHTIMLEGESLKTQVGPVAPLETATIQRTLASGSYQVKAGSKVAMPKEIAPASLTIGDEPANSNDALLLP
ncbi:MAG TPA: hypothetical protein VEQ61_02700 [Thermoleophilaceae bacterium]|nr:hypothetical protein [Thermoleophilaceae bacterium]